MSISPRQLIPRLRKLLQEMGLRCIGNHSFRSGGAQVDLYLPGDPPMVVHRCDRPVVASVRALLCHQDPSTKYRGVQLGFPPLVFPLFVVPPRGKTMQCLEEERIEHAVIGQAAFTEDEVKALAERIRDSIEPVRHQRRIDRIGKPTGGARRSAGRPWYPTDPVEALTEDLDELRGDCERLASDHAAAHVVRELELAEDEITHGHHPASVLHLARAAEALVLHLADRWDARPDVHLLSDVNAIREGVDKLADALSDCENADQDSIREQRERSARTLGVRLVDKILEMLLVRAKNADVSGEDRRTIPTALGDIGRRWRADEKVRAEVKATKGDPQVVRIRDLRNAIAHARTSARDAEIDARSVAEMLDGVHALVRHLLVLRDAIEPLLASAPTVTPRA